MNENELFDVSINILKNELPILRKLTNLTQNDLAQIIGVSRQTIINIENGNSNMKRPTFMALMFLFSLNHDTFSYLKHTEMPYKDLKKWLNQKARR